MSFNSKKILLSQQKKGEGYVPIQYRTSQLLQERQQKIAQKRKEKELSMIIEQRECTFQPKINPKRRRKHGKMEEMGKEKEDEGALMEVKEEPEEVA